MANPLSPPRGVMTYGEQRILTAVEQLSDKILKLQLQLEILRDEKKDTGKRSCCDKKTCCCSP